MRSIVIIPKALQHFATSPHKTHGNHITLEESKSLSLQNNSSQHILCFIGGFLDTYYKILFHIYEISVKNKGKQNIGLYLPHIACCQDNGYHTHTLGQDKESQVATSPQSTPIKHHNFYFMYSSFNCLNFLADFIPKILNSNYSFSVIAHSWGAKNILRLSLKYNFTIQTLITLDCVGHFNITHRPSNILQWENIYIADFYSHYFRPNLAAIIGGGKQLIIHADSNIGIPPPAHHASVLTMLEHSNLFIMNNANHNKA